MNNTSGVYVLVICLSLSCAYTVCQRLVVVVVDDAVDDASPFVRSTIDRALFAVFLVGVFRADCVRGYILNPWKLAGFVRGQKREVIASHVDFLADRFQVLPPIPRLTAKV